MKAKTVKKVIGKKVDDWLATIEDEELRDLLSDNIIVTGGCIASMLLREKVNDYDVYFRTKEAARKAAEYYVGRFDPKEKRGIACKICVDSSDNRVRVIIKSAGIASEDGTKKEYQYFEASPEGQAADYVSGVMGDAGEMQDFHDETEEAVLQDEDEGKPKYRPVFMTTNAITLSDRMQLILRFYGEPDEIHSSYDFVHCMNYWSSKGDELVLRKEALEALLTKELRYVGSKYPICSLIRLRKFIGRGWTVNAGQILKMVMQIGELDLTKPEVLEDQLIGVDVAYFAELISKVKEKDPEKVNSAYLIEIIDRMF